MIQRDFWRTDRVQSIGKYDQLETNRGRLHKGTHHGELSSPRRTLTKTDLRPASRIFLDIE